MVNVKHMTNSFKGNADNHITVPPVNSWSFEGDGDMILGSPTKEDVLKVVSNGWFTEIQIDSEDHHTANATNRTLLREALNDERASFTIYAKISRLKEQVIEITQFRRQPSHEAVAVFTVKLDEEQCTFNIKE